MATRFHHSRAEQFDRSPRWVTSAVRARSSAEGSSATHGFRPEPGTGGRRGKREQGKRVLFGNEMKKVDECYYKARKILLAPSDHKAIRGKVEKRMAEEKKHGEDLAARGPEFVVLLRPHTVWEKMNVTLSCIVQGSPSPTVIWFKDGIRIKPSDAPGKYTIENKIGLQTLEISRCSPVDSGRYSALASNTHGEASSYATILVNKYQGSDAGDSARLHSVRPVPDVNILDGFAASFPKEGGSLTLRCCFSTPLNAQSGEVIWLRDGALLKESLLVKIDTSAHDTQLTLAHVYKEDEGLYTVCLFTPTGCKEHSGYVFVRDAVAAEPGAAGSPLDVECWDVHRDYVLVSWKPPSADGGSAVIGYLIDRKEVGSEEWVQCNHIPEKMCKFPAVGLCENHTYQFRVRAVNGAGISRASRVSEPVTVIDRTAASRIMRIWTDRGEIVVTKDELEGDVRIPLPPTQLRVTEVGQTYAALSWNEPDPRGREPLTYCVEKCVVGSDSWQQASMGITVSCPRFAVTELDKGKVYTFRVKSVNKYGISQASPPSQGISFGQIPAAPCSPRNLVPVRDSRTSVQLLWEGPEDENELIGFYVYACQVGTNNWEICNNKPVNTNRFTVHGLSPRKEYVFRVKSVSPAGLSDYSMESTPIIVDSSISLPSAPYGLTLLSSGKREMVIAWKKPKFPIGPDILGYYLDSCDAAVAEWHEVNIKPIKTRVYKIGNLTEGRFYEFRAFAMNWAGVGPSSAVSDQFKCEQWTTPQPGPPFHLECTEVRSSSLLLHWQPPLYTGKDHVTGYLLELCETEGGEWRVINEKPTPCTHLRVSPLEEGKTYIFRVCALNSAGAGIPSQPSDPVCALTRPGTTEMGTGVDEDGNVFLVFQCPEVTDTSEFIWSKDEQEITTPERVRVETAGDVSRLILVDPGATDLGIYSVQVTGTDGASSSHTLTNEELQKLKELSHRKKHPVIGVKSDWAVELLDKGSVRLWLQVETLSPAAHLQLIFNQKELSSNPTDRINFDKASGLLEMIIQNFTEADQGSYTAQLQDGKATGQFTLVLIGDKFRALLSECDFQRNEWRRKQGPYFEKYLAWVVTDDCETLLTCKVTNTRCQTRVTWSKDGQPLTQPTYDPNTGTSALSIPQITKNDEGVYKVVVSDERGEDSSVLKILNQVFDDILREICTIAGSTASDLKLQPTAEGIKVYSSLKYNMDYMKKSWALNNKTLESQDRRRIGSDNHEVWLQIFNPTEADKGKYTLEMFVGKLTHKRELNLSQKVFDEAIAEYQRLKQAAFAEKNRAKVAKGLPDVVNVMENKALYLSCTVSGDPPPEVCWLKNDKEVVASDNCQVTVDKTSVTFSIQKVMSQDSGRYTLLVRNKYGSESAVITVGVYKCGEEAAKQ